MLSKISNLQFFTVIIIMVGVYYGFVVAKYARYFKGALKKKFHKVSDSSK